MIDFEVVGDLLRRVKMKTRVEMKESPVIILDEGEYEVWFIFDRAGNLKQVMVVR